MGSRTIRVDDEIFERIALAQRKARQNYGLQLTQSEALSVLLGLSSISPESPYRVGVPVQ